MAGEAAPPRDMITIEKHTFGMGDRFGREGVAQLRAVAEANAAGIPLTPVWNKSNREHLLVGSHPDELRAEAAAAVEALGWRGAWHVDADHIGLATVDLAKSLGARVIGISHDDIDTLKRFSSEECRDQFAVGSDPRGQTIKAYDAASLLPGVANRISYVIGQDGRVVFTHEGSNPLKHVEETLKAVQRLK